MCCHGKDTRLTIPPQAVLLVFMFHIWLTILYGLWSEYTVDCGQRRKSCGFPVGKESTSNVGDPGQEDPLERDRLPTPAFSGFPCVSAGKESACNAGDLGLIPRLGRSPGEGKGYPLQHSGLENSMDCIVHGMTESQT